MLVLNAHDTLQFKTIHNLLMFKKLIDELQLHGIQSNETI